MNPLSSKGGHLAASRIGRLALAGLNLYTAMLLVYIVLRVLAGDSFWPVAFAGNFIHWLLLPVVVLLPPAFWMRQKITSAILGVEAAAFVWLFGALFLPHSASATDPADTVRIMSFNVADGRADPGRLADALRASDADVIGLLELGEDQADALEGLRDVYPYQVMYAIGVAGKGLLSRYPIREEEMFYLQSNRLPHLRAELEVNGGALTVFVAHPPPPGLRGGRYWIDGNAGPELGTLADMTLGNSPALLMGDFNTSDQSDNYGLLPAAGLIDAFRAAGWGFGATWPARLGSNTPFMPLVRIDYIWTTPDFQVIDAWVGADAGSDHLPVLAELAWPSQR